MRTVVPLLVAGQARARSRPNFPRDTAGRFVAAVPGATVRANSHLSRGSRHASREGRGVASGLVTSTRTGPIRAR